MSIFNPQEDGQVIDGILGRFVVNLQTMLAALIDPFEQAGERLLTKAGEVFEPVGQRLLDRLLDRLETKTIPIAKAELLGLTVSVSPGSFTITEKEKS